MARNRVGPRTRAVPSVGSARTAFGPLGALSVANAVSVSGNVVAAVAIPWLVLDSTGSAGLAAVSVVSGAVAAAIGALVAGRIVDALGRKRTSAAADLVSGLSLAPIAVLGAAGVLQLWHLVVLVFLGALVDAAGAAARQSLVPAVAAAEHVGRERANSLFTGTEHVGYLVGAPLAGVVISAAGAAAAIWIDIASFVVSAGLVMACVGGRGLPRSGPVRPASPDGGPSLRDAVRLIREDPALRALVVVPTLATVLIGPLVPLLIPVLARHVYGGPFALGLLVSAFGAGGLAGAFAFGTIVARLSRRRLYLSTFMVWPFVYLALAVGAPLPVAVLAVAVLGAGTGSLVSLQATIRQERTPPDLLPRVVGLSTGPVPVVGPLGILVAGILVDRVGIAATLGAMVVAIVALAAGAARLAGVRRFDDSTDLESSRPTAAGPALARTGP